MAVALVVATASARAQEVTYLGTVREVEASRVLVNTVDEQSKKEAPIWFLIDRDTKVKRGDKIVAQTDARITSGERIAVLVDPAAKAKMLATEIRLAVAPSTSREPGQPAAPPAAAGHAEHQQPAQQPMPGMTMPMDQTGWQLMQDGVVYGLQSPGRTARRRRPCSRSRARPTRSRGATTTSTCRTCAGGGEIGHLADRFREMAARLSDAERQERNFLMSVRTSCGRR